MHILTSKQDQISETNRSLEDTRLAVPDFGSEKIRIEADVSNVGLCQT
jgi:hypothetical protein